MKKPVIVAILLLTAGVLSGQTFRKGALVEVSELSVSLKPDASLDNYMELLCTQLAPATAIAFPGSEVYFTKGVRGLSEGKVGTIWVFESVKAKNKFFQPDGSLTPAGEEATGKLAPILEALDEVGTATRTSTDWILMNESRQMIEKNYYEYLMEFCERGNMEEVPVAPSSMGLSDPLLQRLVENLAGSVSELVQSGVKEGDPGYPEHISEIRNSRESIEEAASGLMGVKQPAFHKGASFGLHELTVDLEPGVTMDQFLEYMIDNYVPEVEKHYNGVKILVLQKRGPGNEHKIAWVYYFASISSRDALWPEADTPSEEAEEALNQVQPVLFKLLEMGTWTESYGVWIIQ